MKNLITSLLVVCCVLSINAQSIPDARLMQHAGANYHSIVNLLDSLYLLNHDTTLDGDYASYARWKNFYKDN